MHKNDYSKIEYGRQSAVKSSKEKASLGLFWRSFFDENEEDRGVIWRIILKYGVILLLLTGLILGGITLYNIHGATKMTEFSEKEVIDGAEVYVAASEGTFPKGSTLSVQKVSKMEEQSVNEAVGKVRKSGINVVSSYTYDIKVHDNNANEIQPANGNKVKISFSLKEAANPNLTATVYHIKEDNGTFSAEAVETHKEGLLVVAESDGFSDYTVEFSYQTKIFTLTGGGSAYLTELLAQVGITKEEAAPVTDEDIIAASVGDTSLFTVVKEGEVVWTITSLKSFTTQETLTVTVGEVPYNISIISTTENSYTTPAVASPGWTYDGSAHSLFQTIPVPKGGTVKYQYKKDSGSYIDCSTTAPQVKDAGTYMVNYKVDASPGYTAIEEKNITVVVSPKDLSIKAKDQENLTYGDSIVSEPSMVTQTGLASGDTLTGITLTPGTTDVTNNGTITASNAVISGGAGNYKITYDTGKLAIAPKTITIASGITASNKTYDGNTSATLNYSGINWVACGRVGSDDISVTATGAFADANAGTDKTVNITNLTLQGSKIGNYVLASSGNQESTSANIEAKALTITADNATRDYDGTPLTKETYTCDGLLAEDSIASITITGSITTVGSCDNVPSDAVVKRYTGEIVTGNYNITYVKGSLSVTKKALTITADSITKTYDATTYSKNGYSFTGLAEGDTLTSVTVTGSRMEAGISDNVPSDAVIKNGSDEEMTENYDITYVNGQIEITKKAVTVTALKQTVLLNEEIDKSVKLAELSGAVKGHELSEVTLTSSSTASPTENGEITPSDAKILDGETDVTENYEITYEKGLLTVTMKKGEAVIDNTDGEETSVVDVEVSNLQGLVDEEAEEGKAVKIELAVKPISENKISSETVAKIKENVDALFAFVDKESLKIEYLEIDITKFVDTEDKGTIKDTGTPLEIVITFDSAKNHNPVIIRNHDGDVRVFTLINERPAKNYYRDGTYYVKGDKIYIYSQYFSDFSVAYSEAKTYNVYLNDGNGNVTRFVVGEGTEFIPPMDIKKEGFDLEGWYKDEVLVNKWNPVADTVTEGMVLYAKWVENIETAITGTGDTTPASRACSLMFYSGIIIVLMILTLRRNRDRRC